MARKPAATPEEAHQAAESLRKFWRAGHASRRRLESVRKQQPEAYRYGTKQTFLAQEAARYGFNPDTMKKAWRAAEEYGESDIENLCDLIEQHRARFGPTHLIRLLTLPDRPQRDTLTRTAIRKGWGAIRLDQAILRLRRRRPLVGKRPHLPDDPTERLVVLEGLCLKWTRWCDVAGPELPNPLGELVEAATRAVRRVQKAVAAKIENEAK